MSMQTFQEKHQTKVFNKYFCFFAFNQKQLIKGINRNFKYASLGAGLYAPSVFANKVIDKLEQIHKNAIAKHQQVTSKKDIIWDAFSNYECQISNDLTDAIESLEGYDITKEDIIAEWDAYFDYCCENDYF